MENCRRAGQATDNNMTHARCMMDNYGYKYTNRLCNTNCLLLQHGFTNTPQCYVILMLPVLGLVGHNGRWTKLKTRTDLSMMYHCESHPECIYGKFVCASLSARISEL